MTHEAVWCNGRIENGERPVVSAFDHGFQMGDGLFETIAVRSSRVQFLQRHLSRLRRGMERIDLDPDSEIPEIEAGVHELLAAESIVDARLRITVTPGPGSSPRQRGGSPLRVISSAPLVDAPSSVSLCISEWSRNERSPIAGIKSTSWGENAQILRDAVAAGFDNALLCDSSGRLSECTTSNLFLVIDGQVLTPALDSGCLPGIVREVLLECDLASECELTPLDLEKADEVFITSSVTGVVAVDRIDARSFAIDGPRTSAARDCIDSRSRSE